MDSTTDKSDHIFQLTAEYFNEIRPHIPAFLTLTLAAIIPIYTGAHASLSRPSTAAKPKKKAGSKRHGSQKDNRMEGLTPIDALLYPLGTGAMLTGLYYLIKWLQDPALLNKILNIYLTTFGTVAIWQFVRDFLLVGISFVFPARYSYQSKVWTVDQVRGRFVSNGQSKDIDADSHSSPLPGRLSQLPLPEKLSRLIWKFRKTQTQPYAMIDVFVKDLGSDVFAISESSILAAVVALSAVIYYNLVDRPWWLTNLFGFSFCYSAFQLLSPTTFWTGNLILTSLFFYDIYFVFYTPMMIEVATKLDIPVKLLIPKYSDGSQPGKPALTLLGLGDIVLPGIMLGLALRFDLYMHYLRKQKKSESGAATKSSGSAEKANIITKAEYVDATSNWGERFWLDSKALKHEGGTFSKPYFTAGMIGYVIGMLICQIVMYIAKHGQPALLYLVPSVLGSLWITAAARGELSLMWAYTEDEEAENKKRPSKELGKTSQTDNTSGSSGNELSKPDSVDAHNSDDLGDGSPDNKNQSKVSDSGHGSSDLKNDPIDNRKLFYVSISLPEEPQSEEESSKTITEID